MKFRRLVIFISCSALFWLMLSWQFDWLSVSHTQGHILYGFFFYLFLFITCLYIVGLVFCWIFYTKQARQCLKIGHIHERPFVGLWVKHDKGEGTGNIVNDLAAQSCPKRLFKPSKI